MRWAVRKKIADAMHRLRAGRVQRQTHVSAHGGFLSCLVFPFHTEMVIHFREIKYPALQACPHVSCMRHHDLRVISGLSASWRFANITEKTNRVIPGGEAERQAAEKIIRKAPEAVLRLLVQMVHHMGLKLHLPDEEVQRCVRNMEDREMGELWANMDKIDIQEERRNREEARKKIEKLQDDLQEAQDTITQKDVEITQKDKDLKEAADTITQKDKDLKEATDAITQKDKDLKEAKDEIARLRKELDDLKK